MIQLLHSGIILRMAGATVVSFLIVLLLGPKVIRFLLKKKLKDRPEFDNADLDELMSRKSTTPTMGGILIITSIFASVVLFADLGNMYIRMSLLVLVWLGGLGAWDDWLKLRQKPGASRDGLKSWEKLLFQIALGVLISIFMYHYSSQSHTDRVTNPPHELYFPFTVNHIHLALGAYMIIVVVTMTGASNAVNLTDGMDGLASGCMIIISAVFLVLAWLAGVKEWAGEFHLPLIAGAGEMTILCASMLGACLGFLWHNAPPAQVFMGDTGSLPLGGLLGYVAIVTRQEFLLIIAGGVFVMEAVSVILQVSYFKLTKPGAGMKGKRLFRVAPIHHHFHMGGWAETKVVIRFWVLATLFAALALATLKLR